MNRKVISARRKLVTAILLISSGSSLAQSEQPRAYHMAVIKDAAFGRQMIFGRFENGIFGINSYSSKRANSFAARNNLCVAYTKTEKIAEASVACDAAIAISEQDTQRGDSASKRNAARDLSLAHSNRGVLRAVTGDYDGAMLDFEYAVRISDDVDAAALNLARLKSREQTEMTALQTDH
jgi:tetratricopeptide (TPR) repeat protein